ncbi:polysaccharide deacetylase family protein [Bacillus sp. 1NLA3E]|uniref:polysaccharide deacetylase family protein n=1 Tax=Bacillus sp. 1NLA3E TaxID=666686 RepID=UPI000247E90B|nr:polysaccharide deacetylase family protein [Bacillus sp. 1NLA3E]AGK53099.1 polysaccharide deacetylase family sporulation protein [Bacillus sp. 1NLA3E]
MKNVKRLIIIGLTIIGIVYNPISDQYVTYLKAESINVGKPSNSLYEEIKKNSKQYQIVASDARIDPVWKAIPGYNGLEVDLKASYQKMKNEGVFNKDKLIYRQIKPKVHLNELPPAPIYRGNPDKPMVGFIINVAWGNEYLPDMLTTLKKHHVTASFFLEGRWVKENPDLAKMISESGHEIGNHSFTHPDMKNLSPVEIKNQLVKTNDVIEATTGRVCRWFGPPSGSFNNEVVKMADVLGLGTIVWTVDTIDWQKPTPETIIQRIETKVHPGALILMHPTASTAKALDQLIIKIEQKHLKIGTVSDTLDEKRVF